MKIKLSKNLRSFNCCYSLVDLFFERSFFTLCSWSGQSRAQVDKYAFKSFRRILNCFFNCVRSIDADFTFGECESFFKDKILKHSAQRQRSNSGRISKIKHRPTGIITKKSKKNLATSLNTENENQDIGSSNTNDENKENEEENGQENREESGNEISGNDETD